MNIPLDCSTCPNAICAPIEEPATKPNSQSSGPSVGAIAGGVIGGLVVISIVTYLVWRFFIKTKRQRIVTEIYDDSDEKLDAEKAFTAPRGNRTSTHTVHSVASTVLTRASNIIQIAYIPGVTNRATPTSPNTLLVPPVPPIPMHATSSNPNSPSGYEDQHFFVPGDLRDSTYSGLSGYSDRTSYARTSYAPRSSFAPSIASTIFGKNAVIVAPAQTGMRAKPAVVSVGSGGYVSGTNTPPVPSVDYEKYARPKSRESTFSVGSTFLNNANTATATAGRAQVIQVGTGPNKVNKVTIKTTESPNASIKSPSASSGAHRDSNAPTLIDDSPSVDQGPFSDPPKLSTQKSNMSLGALTEEPSTTSQANRNSRRRSSAERESSPFGDEHATRD
jgi:protein OPY2